MRIVICRLKKIIKKTPFGVDIIVAILAGNGLVDLLISNFLYVPSCGFCAPFWASKSYARNSPIHTSLCVASSIFIFSHFPFPTLFLAVDFVTPLGLQNLTLGTPQFTHLCASLLLFLSFHTFLFLLCS